MIPTVNLKNGNDFWNRKLVLHSVMVIFVLNGDVPHCLLCFIRQVEGETRVGVFASRIIEAGEPLTYDYRYLQSFFSSKEYIYFLI